jgi:hypothetical protein
MIMVQVQPQQRCQDLSEKHTKVKRARGMTQMVECLPSKQHTHSDIKLQEWCSTEGLSASAFTFEMIRSCKVPRMGRNTEK